MAELELKPPVLLDGGIATELQRYGVSVTDPWWTTVALRTPEHRELLRNVHARYVAAGAEVLTANTFRTNLRALQRVGVTGAEAVAFVHAAVDEARAAARTTARPAAHADRAVRVAGSMAPVEDCFQPALVPDDATLLAEHAWHAAALAAAGVDLILVETMNTAREAEIAVRAAVRQGAPVWASFVCEDGARLPSGEPVAEAARRVEAAGAAAVLVNCGTPASCTAALEVIAQMCRVPVGAYPNVEDRTDIPDWTPVDRHVRVGYDPGQLADLVTGWVEHHRVAVVGGCCGSTPEHIRAIGERLSRSS